MPWIVGLKVSLERKAWGPGDNEEGQGADGQPNGGGLGCKSALSTGLMLLY